MYSFAIFGLIFSLLFGGYSHYEQQPKPQKWSSASIDLSRTEKPEVLKIKVSGADNVTIDNMYNVHVLHTGVVGLFGCPVEINADEFEGAKITFYYDENNMNSVHKDNLIALWYDENECCYKERLVTLSDLGKCATLDIDRGGVYMLADKREWFKVWGFEDSSIVRTDVDYKSDLYTPKFQITIPKDIETKRDYPQVDEMQRGYDFKAELYVSDEDYSEIFHSCSYYRSENLWQNECDGWAKTPYTADKFTTLEPLDYTLEGAYAKFYLYTYDCSTRGDEYNCALIMQVKVSDSEMLSFTYSTSQRMDDVEKLKFVEKYYGQLSTFKWLGTPSAEAFTAEKPFDISNYPELTKEAEPIVLTDYTYKASEPCFSIKLPSNISGQISEYKSGIEFDEEYGTQRGLFTSWGTQDIHVSVDYCKGANLWNNREAINRYFFDIKGADFTVEDISASVGAPAEIYTLRYKDTGKVESNHDFIYVIGVYKLSETEAVNIFYDMWADAVSELLPLANDSLKSVRFIK